MKTKRHNIKIVGRVTYGNGLGHSIGFPTANIEPAAPLEDVADGVWAGSAQVGDSSYVTVVNIGYRPTIALAQGHRIEAHLIDFEGDIYGQPISLNLHYHLRGEQKFASLASLSEQIALDKEQALALMTTENNNENNK